MSIFPENVVAVLKTNLVRVPTCQKVFGRRLRPTDPSRSLGVYSDIWSPDDHEIGQLEPMLATYFFGIETFIKHTNEEEARELHNSFAREIRRMLYRDAVLSVALPALVDNSDGMVERVQKWGVRQQRFAANERDGDFLFVSTTEVFLQTETV